MDCERLPEFVCLPDGKSEPFEPERIMRSLFAATERLGVPNAFLAQELAEGVLHFLSANSLGPAISVEQLADEIAKVVRELAHPEIAHAFENRQPRQEIVRASAPWPAWFDPMDSSVEMVRAAAAGPLEEFSLNHVYPPDLVSAHKEGLIRLTDLMTPMELAGVANEIPPRDILNAVSTGRQRAGGFLAIDGPEYDLAAEDGGSSEVAEKFAIELFRVSVICGIRPILNLNVPTPPRSAEGSGPLFDGRTPYDPSRRRQIASQLAERASGYGLTVWWHLAADSLDAVQLHQIISLAQEGQIIEFVIDRPGQPVNLGPGLDRQTPAMLLVVGVNLARLVEIMGGPPVDPAVFLAKVASLARFAKTAGHAKQDFLRKYGRPGMRDGFLLERARLVLVPLGLAVAARATDRPPSEFAREIVKNLRFAAENDRPRQLPIRIDAALNLPGWDPVGEPGMPYRQQVRAASPAHVAAGGGRLVFLPPPIGFDAAEALEAIQLTVQTGICRFSFARTGNFDSGSAGIVGSSFP